ncbi:MAG: hypothetical protein ACXWTH_11840, partial [Methylosarcina sp.]
SCRGLGCPKQAFAKIATPRPAERHPAEPASESQRIDRVAKGVATGVAASIIVQTGRSAIGTLTKNPLFVFGMGLAVGYFANKYRKEILSVSRQAKQ